MSWARHCHEPGLKTIGEWVCEFCNPGVSDDGMRAVERGG